MSDGPIRNLTILSPKLGPIVIQPITNEPEDLEKAQLVIFPQRIAKEHFNVAVEWAASTQTPIFCHSADVKRFEAEGFGAYRFHRLEGYKEVDFEGGAVEFYPARRKPTRGLKSMFQEFGSSLGLLRVPSFHVLIRPHKEQSVLYLGSPQVDASEWEVLAQRRPEWVVGSDLYSKHDWHALSLRMKKKILRASDYDRRIYTVPQSRRDAEAAKENAWSAKAGSL